MSRNARGQGHWEELLNFFLHQKGVSASRMFGSEGLRVSGDFFAMLVNDQLVVRLPAADIDALIAGGHAKRLDPGYGRVMREWIALPADNTLSWKDLAVRSMEYVMGRGRH